MSMTILFIEITNKYNLPKMMTSISIMIYKTKDLMITQQFSTVIQQL